ncbi:MAG: sigma-54 dependent transcriptional regulator [Rickettsiales bacterium]
MTYNILLVDDDKSDAELLKMRLETRANCRVTVLTTGKDAMDALTATRHSPYDLVLLDLGMPGVDGMDVLNSARPIHPALPIVVRTGRDESAVAVEALKAGATDFVCKTDSFDKLEKTVKTALLSSKIDAEMARYHNDATGRKTNFNDILGESAAVKEMIACAKKAANSDISVLIEGESGCGKELLARAIHNAGRRADKPFIAVNCGAIPENLAESVLFGHEKGAFTGAIYKAIGKFREADGGTIFLDEVGELSPDAQTKLLRALESGEIDAVGSHSKIKVDVRVISATNRDLTGEVRAKAFREDLYYRLNVFPVHVPPLRERAGDVPMLVRYYAGRFSHIEGKAAPELSSDAMRLLETYSWPGNVRQLKNAIYRAVVLSEDARLESEFFPSVASDAAEGKRRAARSDGVAPLPEFALSVIGQSGHARSLEEMEKEIIEKTMARYHGCISEASRRLGVGRSTLYRKMYKYALHRYLDEGDATRAAGE